MKTEKAQERLAREGLEVVASVSLEEALRALFASRSNRDWSQGFGS